MNRTGVEFRWPLFGQWAAAGALIGLGLHDPFSRTLLLLVPGTLLTVLLMWQVGRSRESFGLLSGLSLFPLVVAWTGEGRACPADGGMIVCTSAAPNPLPWLVAGICCLATGAGLARGAIRRRRSGLVPGAPR